MIPGVPTLLLLLSPIPPLLPLERKKRETILRLLVLLRPILLETKEELLLEKKEKLIELEIELGPRIEKELLVKEKASKNLLLNPISLSEEFSNPARLVPIPLDVEAPERRTVLPC